MVIISRRPNRLCYGVSDITDFDFANISSNFMNTIDLQNGVFEEEGLKMLAQWEKQSIGVLLGEEKAKLLNNNEHELDINMDVPKKNPVPRAKGNQYTNLFD